VVDGHVGQPALPLPALVADLGEARRQHDDVADPGLGGIVQHGLDRVRRHHHEGEVDRVVELAQAGDGRLAERGRVAPVHRHQPARQAGGAQTLHDEPGPARALGRADERHAARSEQRAQPIRRREARTRQLPVGVGTDELASGVHCIPRTRF
jgi:hypothetical protein